LKLLFLLWLLLSPLLAWAQPVVAGRVEATEGDVRFYDAANVMRPALPGEPVHEGESIVTGADGEVHLAMADEGQIAVRPNTRLRIAKYRADGGSSDVSTMALVQGALRSVTGWIGKFNPRRYSIRTPTATIGVRGTDHETRVIPEGSDEGAAGTYDKVNAGATLLSTKHGQTEIRPNQAGFVALSGESRPRVLASVPSFFRPARLDPRFEKLHEKVRERVDIKRSERIQQLKERRSDPDLQRQERRQERSAEHRNVQDGRREDARRQQESWKERQRERREPDLPRRTDERKRGDADRQARGMENSRGDRVRAERNEEARGPDRRGRTEGDVRPGPSGDQRPRGAQPGHGRGQ
jgi:hypothetical protein